MPNFANESFRAWLLSLWLALGIALVGCGSTPASATPSLDYASASSGQDAYAAPALPSLALESSATESYEVQSVSARPEPRSNLVSATTAPAPARARSSAEYASASPAPAPDVAPPLPGAEQQTATDATPGGPILVYRASFLLSVYEVEKAQVSLKKVAQDLGGFVSSQNDTQLTLRIPSPKFEAALSAVEVAGKVRARHVDALDVGHDYRDLGIRLHTAELMRARFEAMLAQAKNVSEALQVEAELERIVREIEQLKGQLRMLTDQIAFSTLTIEFRPESRPDLDDSEVFRLPYPWLEELGLHQLLELSR
jgi:hypothetical protein